VNAIPAQPTAILETEEGMKTRTVIAPWRLARPLHIPIRHGSFPAKVGSAGRRIAGLLYKQGSFSASK
jgi:hypothetical protein